MNSTSIADSVMHRYRDLAGDGGELLDRGLWYGVVLTVHHWRVGRFKAKTPGALAAQVLETVDNVIVGRIDPVTAWENSQRRKFFRQAVEDVAAVVMGKDSLLRPKLLKRAGTITKVQVENQIANTETYMAELEDMARLARPRQRRDSAETIW